MLDLLPVWTLWSNRRIRSGQRLKMMDNRIFWYIAAVPLNKPVLCAWSTTPQKSPCPGADSWVWGHSGRSHVPTKTQKNSSLLKPKAHLVRVGEGAWQIKMPGQEFPFYLLFSFGPARWWACGVATHHLHRATATNGIGRRFCFPPLSVIHVLFVGPIEPTETQWRSD